jgi:hypothetical protein
MQSTIVSVPSSELAPPPFPPASVIRPTWILREIHSLGGEGVGGSQFIRPARNSGTLYTLWTANTLVLISYSSLRNLPTTPVLWPPNGLNTYLPEYLYCIFAHIDGRRSYCRLHSIRICHCPILSHIVT